MYKLLLTDLMQTRFNKDQEDGHIHLNVIDKKRSTSIEAYVRRASD